MTTVPDVPHRLVGAPKICLVYRTGIYGGMTTDWDTYQGTKYFGSLDGLRCVAITAVIWHHTSASGADPMSLVNRSHMGAYLFLLLTGFLITTLLLRERRKHGFIALGNFYARRLLRIVPLYYAVLMAYVILVMAVEPDSPEGKAFIEHLPYYLTFTSNWGVSLNGRVIFYFAWTLAAIVQFYLLWAPVEKYLKGVGPVVAAVGVIVMAEAALWNLFGDRGSPLAMRSSNVLNSLAMTCLGALLAHGLHHPGGYKMIRKLIGWRWSSVAALLMLIGGMCVKLRYPPLPTHCAMVLLVGCCVIREDHALAPFLRLRIIQHLGVVSYGMYLLHMLVFNVVKRVSVPLHLQCSPWYFASTLIGVALVATLSFRYYESYFFRFRSRFGS